MILAGGGIHARPDSTAFNLELQRLAETIRSNVKLESDEGIVCSKFLGSALKNILGLFLQKWNFQFDSFSCITSRCS